MRSSVRAFEKTTVNIPLRVTVSVIVSAVCFFTILLRLWYLQILNGEYFRARSENNRLRTTFIAPPRGLILDRNGKVLVRSRPAFNVELVSEDAPRPKESLAKLAEILGMKRDSFYDALKHQKKRRRYEPKVILQDVSREIVAKVMSRAYQLPGIVINVFPAREYVYGALAAHAFGYIREIGKAQLDLPKYAEYRRGDLIGQSGIEAKWESYLQGKRGVQNVIVNATGTRIGEASFTPEIPGNSLTLTLDYDVQAAADEGLLGKRGSIVALSPQTGEILAMSSAPIFDPNMFSTGITTENWRNLIRDKTHPLNNKAIRGGYPPGSTFKMIMATALLASKMADEKERVSCPGYYPFGNRTFSCWKKTGHGPVNLKEAVIRSCDVYFYTMGVRMGIDRIADFAHRFGLGSETGFDNDEIDGVVPSPEWKKAYFKNPAQKPWFPGETVSVSIGQGALVVTPLQMARALAALVNGGRLLAPHIVKRVDSSAGVKLETFGVEEMGTLGVNPEILDKVRDAMVGVVNDPNGTAARAKLDPSFGILVGGKTGTSQAHGAGAKEHMQDHGWFIGFAPAENPEIVVSALIENGGHGGVVAAPLVRKVMEAYFLKKKALEEGATLAELPRPAPTQAAKPAEEVPPEQEAD